MGQDSREVWAQRVARWRDSDLTAKEFGNETGVNPRTLAYWSWRLGVKGKPKPKVRKPVTKAPPSSAPRFVELAAPPAATPEPVADCERLEVVLAGGLRISVPNRFDAATLRSVVDALMER